MTNGKVLIIDDDKVLRGLVVNTLSASGFKVYEAGDGAVGIEMALMVEPDIILLDVAMENLDGYDTCKLLKQSPTTKIFL